MEEQKNLNQEPNQENVENLPGTRQGEEDQTQLITPPPTDHRKTSEILHWVVEGVLLAAVVVLFVLFFLKSKKEVPPTITNAKPGSGEIMFVNLDTIQEKYVMVNLLLDSIEAEKQKQTVVFQNRQNALETKYANFQENYQTGQLSQKQVEYAQMSLQQESEQLQNDYQQAVDGLQSRYTAALQQVADSLNAACKRINVQRNASFIFSYQSAGQMLYADPTKDITDVVLYELNKSFKTSSKKKTSKK